MSILSAAIFLAYAIARFVEIPERELAAQLPGFYLEVQFNIQTAVAVLVAGLAASGAYWYLETHPAFSPGAMLQHLILPALTASVVAVSLNQIPAGVRWWTAYVVGSCLVILVVVAEYIILDRSDPRHPLATAALTAISFALFLILAISLRGAGVRLFWLLPSLAGAAALVSLRTFHLRMGGRWQIPQAVVVALVVGQLAAALHYWPVSAITFGLTLVGTGYGLTGLINNLDGGDGLPRAALEPALFLLLTLFMSRWIG